MELDLGLGIGARSAVSTRPRRLQEQKQPSLTLSLSDGVHDGRTAQPKVIEEGRQTWPSSPHSTVSSFSTVYSAPLVKKEKELGSSEEVEEVIKVAAASRLGGYDDNDGGARKKLRLTKEQSAMLEDKFKEHSTLSPKQKHALAKQLNLRPRQVEVWFQNRRARTKLKQTEVDCELLKKCCESLTDENRRLHKELQELKSLKLAPPPPVYMQFPAATLTMCPSCNTIAGGNADSTPKGGGGDAAESFTVAPKPLFFNPFTHSARC